MNTKTIALVVAVLVSASGALRAEETNSPFQSLKQKASYAIGLNMGNSWKSQEVEFDYDFVFRGLNDARGDKQLLTQDEIRETLTAFKIEYDAQREGKRQAQCEKNKTAGEAYLAENKSKAGVVTTETGLQYKVIAEGEGNPPAREDMVTVNYRGTLVDGTEFDSSAKAGRPAEFRVTGVIAGWTEALLKMKPGAKWELAIPYNLAYGEAARSEVIGPCCTLLFEVELVSVKPQPQKQPLTSDIIKVPSVEEMKKGAKIETIKAEDLEKLQREEQEKKNQQD